MTNSHPDSPEDELDKILHRLGDIGVTWFGGIDEGVAEAKQAIHEYYTNKFLEIVDKLPHAEADVCATYNSYNDDEPHFFGSTECDCYKAELRKAIKQLSKRGE